MDETSETEAGRLPSPNGLVVLAAAAAAAAVSARASGRSLCANERGHMLSLLIWPAEAEQEQEAEVEGETRLDVVIQPGKLARYVCFCSARTLGQHQHHNNDSYNNNNPSSSSSGNNTLVCHVDVASCCVRGSTRLRTSLDSAQLAAREDLATRGRRWLRPKFKPPEYSAATETSRPNFLDGKIKRRLNCSA